MAYRYRLYPTADRERILGKHCADAAGLECGARTVQLLAARAGSFPRPDRARPPARRGLTGVRLARRGILECPTAGAPGLRSGGRQLLRTYSRAAEMAQAWPPRGLLRARCHRPQAQRPVGRAHGPLGRATALSRLAPAVAGRLGTARVTLDGKHRWHVSFPGPQPALEREPTGAIVGVDRGVAATLVFSDGRMLRAPVMRVRERRRLGLLQRRLVRQRKGSRRRERTKGPSSNYRCESVCRGLMV